MGQQCIPGATQLPPPTLSAGPLFGVAGVRDGLDQHSGGASLAPARPGQRALACSCWTSPSRSFMFVVVEGA